MRSAAVGCLPRAVNAHRLCLGINTAMGGYRGGDPLSESRKSKAMQNRAQAKAEAYRHRRVRTTSKLPYARNLANWFLGKSLKLLPPDVRFKAKMHEIRFGWGSALDPAADPPFPLSRL